MLWILLSLYIIPITIIFAGFYFNHREELKRKGYISLRVGKIVTLLFFALTPLLNLFVAFITTYEFCQQFSYSEFWNKDVVVWKRKKTQEDTFNIIKGNRPNSPEDYYG